MEEGSAEKRFEIPYWEGINSIVSLNTAKKSEIFHAENTTSNTIGSIEKRAGQTPWGYSSGTTPFTTNHNSGIFYFDKPVSGTNQGLYRLSEGSTPSLENLYYLNNNNVWTILIGKGSNISPGLIDNCAAEQCMFIVNHTDNNRYILANGTTVKDSADADGHLWNSPKAHFCRWYKNKLYLANFTSNGVDYPTTVMQSSFPMGLISLFGADYPTPGSTLVNAQVTDTKYIYTDSGANGYEVYRGPNKVADIVVNQIGSLTVNLTSIAFSGSYTGFLASDEIWISGTYTGAKVIRWAHNPTMTGIDTKQYDTFKLAGGTDDGITMLENIGNDLFIGNKNNLCSWNGYLLQDFDIGYGCVSPKGYIKLYGSLYFIHYSGIYSSTGSVPKYISAKMDRYFKGATKAGLEASASGKKGRSVFFTLGDVTLYNQDGSLDKVLHDVCLEFNSLQENWFVHTNVKASQFATFIENTDVDRLMFIDTGTNHKVKEFMDKNASTDDGQEIFMRIDLNKITMNPVWEKTNSPLSLILETERGRGMKVFVSTEEGNPEWYELQGTVEKGISVLKVTERDSDRGMPPPARLLAISLRDSTPQICKILRVGLRYTAGTEDAIIQ